MIDSASLTSFLESMNSEDNIWPFVVSFFFFGSAMVYCYVFHRDKKKPFMKWNAIHDCHNYLAMLMATVALLADDDSVFNERIPILFSLAYFAVDLPDTIIQKDIPYFFHAVLCITCGYLNYTVPLYRELRLNSKASLCEISSPFLHLAKRSRNPLHMALFFVMFTVFRILWIPKIMMDLYQGQGEAWFQSGNLAMPALIGFYVLNIYWYYRIILIGLRTVRGEDDKKKKKES